MRWLSSPRVAHVYAEAGGRRMHLLDFGGSGRRVVLVHGVGAGAWTWQRVGPQLAALGHVLAVDLCGYGQSQWARDGSYGTQQHAADLEALLTGGEPADVIGFSWGALVGLTLAARAPQLVRRLAVVDIGPAPAGSPTDVPPMPVAFDAPPAAVRAQRALAPRAPDETLALAGALQTHPGEGGGLVRASDPALTRRWPFRDDDLWAVLPGIRARTLVVRAEQSPVLDEADAAAMTAALPRAEMVTVRDCGHLVPLERPEALGAALNDFLATPD